ncbi:hypothetical protein F2Q68_00000813 [Brassica cretica]|uniref:Malectin-like domain-containing protein n=1 Tax=Brassica cretica TaxID=69181 RepID=A0A8S9JI41_BRACR|nr:hypothetical protein F2Q68_00000813 [Brassica cretica]
MEISLALLLVLVAISDIIHLVQAQSQPGFISLDCGLPANEPSPYSESKTGLRFSSDSKFIQTGEIGRIQTNLENPLKPYTTLRYFSRRNTELLQSTRRQGKEVFDQGLV